MATPKRQESNRPLERSMESQEKSNAGYFQMPLHYPRYTKEEYQDMPEGKLDRLLAEYGLSVRGGDLAYKREFAMGAFLWPVDLVVVEPPPRRPLGMVLFLPIFKASGLLA